MGKEKKTLFEFTMLFEKYLTSPHKTAVYFTTLRCYFILTKCAGTVIVIVVVAILKIYSKYITILDISLLYDIVPQNTGL